MRIVAASLVLLCSVLCVSAQEGAAVSSLNEKRVALTEPAVALDASGASALEATLRTTALNGAPDTPVTNIRMIVRNRSSQAYAFVSGSVTFYDAAGVRCGLLGTVGYRVGQTMHEATHTTLPPQSGPRTCRRAPTTRPPIPTWTPT